MTSKLQVTVPKAIAERFGIRPGDDIEWIPAGDAVRVQKLRPRTRAAAAGETALRLQLFDQATERQRERQRSGRKVSAGTHERGWRRDDVYDRGRAR